MVQMTKDTSKDAVDDYEMNLSTQHYETQLLLFDSVSLLIRNE